MLNFSGPSSFGTTGGHTESVSDTRGNSRLDLLLGLSNAFALSEINVLLLGPRGAARVGIVFDRLRSDLMGDSDATGDVPSVGVLQPLCHSSGGEGS